VLQLRLLPKQLILPELLLPKQPALLKQPLLRQKLPMPPKHLLRLVLLMARH
jgi:hypothetical protein